MALMTVERLAYDLDLRDPAINNSLLITVYTEDIHSFIHSGYLCSAPSRNLLRGALSPATVKEKCLKKLEERRHFVLR